MRGQLTYEALKGLFHFDGRNLQLYTIYFLLGFTSSLNRYSVLKDFKSHNVSMSTLSSLAFIPNLPWGVKCLFAGFSDSISVCGYHRKPYMIVGNFLSMIFSLVMLVPYITIGQFVGILTSLQTSVVVSDVNYDAVLLEECKKLPDKEASALLMRVKSMRTLGSLLGKTLGPICWALIASSGVYIILAFVYFLAFLVSVSIPDLYRPSETLNLQIVPVANAVSIELNEFGDRINPDATEQVYQKGCCCRSRKICFVLSALKESVTNKFLGPLLLFTIATGLCPTADLPMFYYLTDNLHYTEVEMSALAFTSEIGHFLGFLLYSKVFSRLKIRNTYFILTILTVLAQCIPLLLTTPVPKNPSINCDYNSTALNNTCYYFDEQNIPPMALSVTEGLMNEAVSELFWIPVERITTIVCVSTVEATIYAFVLSVANLTGSLKGFVDMFFIIYFDIDHGKTENLLQFQKFCIYLEVIAFLFSILLPYYSTAEITEKVKEERMNINQQELQVLEHSVP